MIYWNIGYPVAQVRKMTEAIANKMRERISEGAMAVGISVLGNAQQAYEAKSRHGTGSDGITWKELKPETLEARVRRRAPSRRIVERRAELAAEIRNLTHSPGKAKTSKGRISEAARIATKIKTLRQKRDDLKKQHEALVAAEIGNHQIGVDTGLQRASASPGFSDPHGIWSKSPVDSLGQNLFVVNGGEVAIGYHRDYSAAFDAVRPLFPDTLPTEWRADAEEIAHEWASEVIRSVAGP